MSTSPALNAAVQATIRGGLASAVDPVDVEDNDAVRAMFDGQLGELLDVRTAVVTSLVAELVEAAREANPASKVVPIDPSGAIKGYAGGRPTGAPAPSISWLLGIDLAQLAGVTGAMEVMAYAASPERVLVDLEAYLEALPALDRARRHPPPAPS